MLVTIPTAGRRRCRAAPTHRRRGVASRSTESGAGHRIRHPDKCSYLMVISYDGTDFVGFQVQQGQAIHPRQRRLQARAGLASPAAELRTVQQELERAMCKRLQVSAESLALKVRLCSDQGPQGRC